MLLGLRHSRRRDSEAIGQHYDVSNAFYEYVLGRSMAYTCAVFETADTTLDDAQYAKFDLVARKLALEPGMRLLDVGCGWGSLILHAAEHYDVHATGVTLSAQQRDHIVKLVAERLGHLWGARRRRRRSTDWGWREPRSAPGRER